MFLFTSISSGTTETRAMFRKPPAVKGRMYLEKTYHSRKSWFHGELFVKYKCIIFSHEQGLQIIAALKGERHEGPQQADQGCADLGSGSLPPGFCFHWFVDLTGIGICSNVCFLWHLSKPDFSKMAKSPNSWGICKYKSWWVAVEQKIGAPSVFTSCKRMAAVVVIPNREEERKELPT